MHAAAFNGMPDPVFHLTARAMAIVTGLAAVEPDPRAPDNDVLLDAALQAATGLAQLLRFRGACATAESARRARSGDRVSAQRRGRADEGRRGRVRAAGARQDQRRGRPHRRLRPQLSTQRLAGSAVGEARRVRPASQLGPS